MKAIPGFDGYFVDEDNQVVSCKDGQRVLKQRLKRGYFVVTLKVAGVRGCQYVHRLILLAHQGCAPVGREQCRHLNGNRVCNEPDNLSWGSATENAADAVLHRTLGPGMLARRRKLNEHQVTLIKARMHAGECGTTVAQEFGLSVGYPALLLKGGRWSAGRVGVG